MVVFVFVCLFRERKGEGWLFVFRRGRNSSGFRDCRREGGWLLL